MAYSSGFLKDRIRVINKLPVTDGRFGRGSAGIQYTLLGTFHANVAWVKGVKALREGAMEAYDTVLIRMRYRETIDHDSLILHGQKVYAVMTVNADYQANELQLTCQQQPEAADYYLRQLVDSEQRPLVTANGENLLTTENTRKRITT